MPDTSSKGKKNKIGEQMKTEKELIKWNEEVNKEYPMEIIEKHPNPLIRIQERNRRNIIISLAKPYKNKTVTDVGCEAGYLTKEMAKQAKLAYGVDIDKNLLKKAAKKSPKNTKWVKSNIHNIKLKDNTTDITICTCVLEHVPDIDKAMDELIRITKPEGKLIIDVPNEEWVLLLKKTLKKMGLSFMLGGLSKDQAHGHIHTFNKKKLERLMDRKDLEIEKIRYDFPFYTNVFVKARVIKTP